MKIVVVAGKQRGLNFIERGQIGVIRIFSMFLYIKGPFRDMLFPKEPKGVEMRSPSPLNCPIFMT